MTDATTVTSCHRIEVVETVHCNNDNRVYRWVFHIKTGEIDEIERIDAANADPWDVFLEDYAVGWDEVPDSVRERVLDELNQRG